MTTRRAGSLFTGVLGLDQAAADVFGAELAWTCDNDEAAAKVITHRAPGVPNLGDITAVDWGQVEPVWLLTGGSPCQDVSSAGKRAGMYPDTRSGLWAHMSYAVKRLRPRYVVFENVRGLSSACAENEMGQCPGCVGDGPHRPFLRALGRVLGDMADLGYDTAWCGLPASAVGAPHERFRIFILAVDTTADPKGDGRHEGRPEPAGQQRGSDAPLGGGAAPADAAGPRRSRHLAGAAVARDGAAAAIAREVQPGGLNRAPANADYIGPVRAGGTRGRWPGSADGGDAPTDSDGAGLERREPAAGHDLPAGGTLADASAGGWRPGEPDLRTWESDTAGSGYARPAPHPDGDGREVVQRVESGVGSREDTDGRGEIDWGIYTAAIQRWERVVGRPAPVPRVVGPRGGLKLNPALPEWMQGFPAGWITDVPGMSVNDALKLAGNSVNPYQAVAALRWLSTQLAEETAACLTTT